MIEIRNRLAQLTAPPARPSGNRRNGDDTAALRQINAELRALLDSLKAGGHHEQSAANNPRAVD